MKAYWQRCIVLVVFFASLAPLYAEVASVRLTLSGKKGQVAAGSKRSPDAIPTAYAVETDAAPVLDGKLSDPCWACLSRNLAIGM